MFIRLVVKKDNLPYIFNIAVKLKTVADAQSAEYDKVRLFLSRGLASRLTRLPVLQALHILSELSQHLLKRVAAINQWPIPTYPGNVPLPGDIFKALTPSKAQQVCSADHRASSGRSLTGDQNLGSQVELPQRGDPRQGGADRQARQDQGRAREDRTFRPEEAEE